MIFWFTGELGSIVLASSNEDRPRYIAEITLDSDSFTHSFPAVLKYPLRAPFTLFPHLPSCLSVTEDLGI